MKEQIEEEKLRNGLYGKEAQEMVLLADRFDKSRQEFREEIKLAKNLYRFLGGNKF